MNHINNVKQAFKEVYSFKQYWVISISIAFIIFSFNALVNNYRILISNFSIKLFFTLLFGTIKSMSMFSHVLLLIMSILAGIVLSMSIFLIKRQIKGSVGTSTSTILVSLIAPACPSCAIGLLSTLGIGGFLGFLPFKGLEFGFIALLLLSISLMYLSEKIVSKTCKLKMKKKD